MPHRVAAVSCTFSFLRESDGTIVNLNDSLGASSRGWRNVSVTQINDSGTVAGTYQQGDRWGVFMAQVTPVAAAQPSQFVPQFCQISH
jgi:hypothetical protein